MLNKNTLIPVAAVMLVSSNMNVFANEVEQSKSSENEYKKITYKTGKSNTKMGKVNSSRGLNVRSTPRVEDGNKLYALANGTDLEIIDEQNDWYKVKVENKKSGWVSSDYVDLKSKSLYVSATRVNFRSGPSTSYSIIGKLSIGDKVEVISTSNGWSKIRYNGKIGYASSKYLSSSSPELNTITKKYVNVSSLNVRSGPSTNNSIIGKLSNGDKVEVISTSNGWSKIKYSGKTGYVSSKYLSSTVSDSSDSDSSASTSSSASKVISLAKTLLGKPYVWGAEGPNAFDCSGLMTYIFKNGAGINLPRTSTEQSKYGKTVSKSDLKPGDLIFSSTNGTGKVSHVGVYVGNGEMIHAPKPGDVVKKSKINNSYWNNAYLWSKRVL